ncbi:MAG: hypothetical protein ACP5XB_02790, partial [Isosphaeraceae bacterium]
MLKKLRKMATVLALLIGAYLGYVRAFNVVVGRLTAARRFNDFKFVVHDSKSKGEAIKQARESFGPDHWTAKEDLQLRYYNGERGFWMYSQHYDRIIKEEGVQYDGKRLRLTPAAIVWKKKNGRNTYTVTSEVATLDFNQPLSLNPKPDAEPMIVKYARLERNVMIRDDKGTPADKSDDMIIGPLTYVDYDDDKLQIRSDSDVLVIDVGTRIKGVGMEIQLRPKSEPVSGGRSTGFEGAQAVRLYKNVEVVFHDIGKTGFLPGSARTKKTATGKVEVKAQVAPQQADEASASAEPVPLDVHCDGPMLVELPKPRLPVKVGPPALPAPTMVHFTRNVVVRRGKPTEQPDRLESDNLDLTLVQAEKPPATEGKTASESKESQGVFGDLTLDRVHATGHMVWLHQPLRGAKILCNEMIHEVAYQGNQDRTYFRVDTLRKHWLLEKYDFTEERPQGQNGPVQRKAESVTYVWATDATLFDTGGDMERAALVARGPGRMETFPVSPDPASVRDGVPADRIVTWQDILYLKNEVRPHTEISERVLTLTGKPWVFDRDQQSSLQAAYKIVAWLEPKPAAAKNATAPPPTNPGNTPPKKPDSEDGGYQIRRLLALNDAHLVAPSKNLTARNRLDVSFVQAPKPEVATGSPAPGLAPNSTAAPAASPETQAASQAPAKEKQEPNMVALADLVEATIVVDSNPDAQNAKGKSTAKASAAGTAGDPNSTYEVRDARLFGKVSLHQDPSPGKTKGQDAAGEALILHNEGPGKAIFN